jgi:hypothetical protein
MKKLLLATIAAATVLVSANAHAAPGDERPAASLLLGTAAADGIKDGLFIWCRHYDDMTACKMAIGNMVLLRDKPFAADACKAPNKKGSQVIDAGTLYTCVSTVGARPRL